MPKVVNSPDGAIVVIGRWEFMARLVERQKFVEQNVISTSSGDVCKRCGDKVFVTKIYHVPHGTADPRIPTLDEIDPDMVLKELVCYCLKCDPVPEVNGEPVVFNTSYYCRVN